MTFYSFLFLFFAYSFLGWVGEVLYTAVTRRRYQDRGVLSGPLCILYGIGAKRKWLHSVFHIFVVLGSVLHFFAIFLYAL